MLRLSPFVAALLLIACNAPNQRLPVPPPDAGQDTATPDTSGFEGDIPEESGPTYHSDVRAIVERNCVRCHDPGGIGPFELDTFESLSAVADVALHAIESGKMPPWLPDPACRDFADERLMSDADKATFRAWVEAGKPEGEPSEYVEPDIVRVELGEPDVRARPYGAFRPTVERGDQYRCFLLEREFPEETFVTAINVDPGNRSLVHHSNIFLVNPTNAARAQEIEDRDAEAGYSCFGDAGVSTLNMIGAWVPGMEPIVLPGDRAIRIPAGSRIVMQTHFNSLYAELDDVLQEVQLWTRDTPPEKVVRAMPFANLSFVIPPGEPESTHVINVKNLSDEPWEVFGTAAHLHMLAKQVKLERIRAGGESECLLDIPDWDFAWQQAYFYEQQEWTQVDPGEVVRLTCTFDNSPENQPVVDGVQRTPQEVEWGGGTFDEMCIAFLIVAEDYEPLPEGALCDPFKACRAECDDPFSVGCVFNCASVELDCGECLLFGAQRCAERHCRSELQAASPCLLTCAQGAQGGGNIDDCLLADCPEERNALETCLRPVIETGLCNDDIANCNVEF